MNWPAKIKKAGLFKGLSSSLDIYATCLDAAGKADHAGKALDGTSLIRYLTGAKNGSPHDLLFWRKDQDAAVRFGDYKMIRVDELGYRLYDLGTDLGETKNLTEKQPKKFTTIKKAMADWESQLISPLWTESEEWKNVSWMIHEDLYHNRPVRVKNPNQLRRYKAAR